MKELIEAVAYLLILTAWLAGIAIAKGVISTTMAILLPPYAWYLIVEASLRKAGWI